MIFSAEEFARLRTSTNPSEHQRAACEEAPVSVWLDVIERFVELRRWVAHNKTVPIEVLETLADDPDSDVRWTVAMRRKTPGHILQRLAGDPDESVRLRVAMHRNTPHSALELLSRDSWDQVRQEARRRLDV